MEYRTLGASDISVSRLCLGSMSWGTRNTEDEAHAQLDRCLEAGLNFVDTAEMYPTYPAKAETVGRTEEIIGTWNAKSGRRAKYIIATKVSGPNGGFVRDGKGYDGAVIAEAADTSLGRLQTDVIDLYQLHWPVRKHYHFRRNWDFDPTGESVQDVRAHMLDVLDAMGKLVKAGKIRAFGLSNETTWGTAEWIRLADANGLPRPVTVQNEYSLTCRLADTDLAELCHFENVGLLPFTPMVAGLLSAEHGPDQILKGSRREHDATVSNRVTDRLWPAAAAYRGIAEKHGLDVNQLALAFTLSRPFVTSTIFGATSQRQLELALATADMTLSPECLADISAAHRTHPMPF